MSGLAEGDEAAGSVKGRDEMRRDVPAQGSTRLEQAPGTWRPCPKQRNLAAEVTGASGATRGAGPPAPRRRLHLLLSEPKKRLSRGLTETPGPCCRLPEGLRPWGRCAGL